MDIVRSNYDTLTLKLQDGLDHFERYSEVPKEQQFFTNLVSNELRLVLVSITLIIFILLLYMSFNLFVMDDEIYPSAINR